MKRIFLILCVSILSTTAIAQSLTYQQKLYYSCKVWGFVKYYHSRVSVCEVNWDSVLLHTLPLIKNASTTDSFNDALDTMLLAAGPMAIATSPLPDTIPPELKRNRNFGWINDPVFRTDVVTILDTIKNNFRPHNSCWVQNNNYASSYGGWLVFPYDSLMITTSTYINYPDEYTRLLLLFKYWNIINYFNPYNYIHDIPWDSTLYDNASSIANAPNDTVFVKSFKKITSEMDDAHAEILTYSDDILQPDGYYYAPLVMARYIPGKYVVSQSTVKGISAGDEIISVDGLMCTQWEDSLAPYISAGNISVFRRTIASYMFSKPYGKKFSVVTMDSLGNTNTTTVISNSYTGDTFFYSYFPDYDTLANVKWRKWGCNIGYVNMATLDSADVNPMYAALQNTTAIIFDLRDYPNETAWPIANLMYSSARAFSKFSAPSVTYPGTFTYSYDSLGVAGNPSPYKGKVIILMDEQTQSQAEYSCMILSAMPDVVKIGSQTAGTDGDVTYFLLSPDIETGFTTLGIFYPNGDSTERIGIVPDSVVYPTESGLWRHRDEVLEKALQVAQCALSVPEISSPKPEVVIFPNPTGDILNVNVLNIRSGNIIIDITDLTGKIIATKEMNNDGTSASTDFNVSLLSGGMYLLDIKNNTQNFTCKFIKQ